MFNIKFLPTQFSICLIVGILLGYFFSIPLSYILIGSLTTYIALYIFYFIAEKSFKPPYVFAMLTTVIFVLLGVLRVGLQQPKNQKNNFENRYSENNKLLIRIDKVLKNSNYYNRYEGEVLQVENRKARGKLLIYKPVNQSNNNFIVEDLILTNMALKKIKTARNPNTFDYKAYLEKKGIHYQINLVRYTYLKVKKNKKTQKGIAFGIREKINTSLKTHNFSLEELAIINAILLGQRNNISTEVFESYRDAGAIHILAVSGLHIGIILLLLNFILLPLESIKNGKYIKLFLVVLFLWMYAFIAGMSASVVRAVTMFSAISIGMVSNRPSSVKHSLVVSLFILLLIHPLFLFDVGFQLSYIAVFSIVWLHPYFDKLWKPKHKIINYFWKLLSISFAAQLGILPLSLYYFHQFPGLFFLSSLVIIPFLGIILGLGILVIILSLTNLLPKIIALFYGKIIDLMNVFVAWIAGQKNFIFDDIYYSILLMLAMYLFYMVAINWINNKTIKNLSYLFLGLIFIQLVVIYEKIIEQGSNEFIVFHQSKNTLITNRIGNKWIVYKPFNNDKIISNKILNTYKNSYRNLQTIIYQNNMNVLKINKQKILIVDSLGVYKDLLIRPDIIILTQSPKINLERMISELEPQLIIADGSNYKSRILKWQQTAKKHQINFHTTYIDGAFVARY